MSLLSVNIKEYGYMPIYPNIRNIRFEVNIGQIIAIIGASGSGKTTLLKLAAGLIYPHDGDVINHFNKQAYLFQETRLLPWKNCLDNITLSQLASKVDKKKARQYALLMGLNDEDLKKYPTELSGGMRQRVALARAFITEPDLLFLDEPFGALDFMLREEMQQLLLGQIELQKRAVLMVTHDLDEAIKLADMIIVLGGEPAEITKSISISKSRETRDAEYIFVEKQRLMQMPEIITSFKVRNQ